MIAISDPVQLRRLAEDKRQQAADIVRFIRRSDHGYGASRRRRAADELYREAEDIEVLAERAGGAS